MITITLNDDYEKAIMVLSLRQFAQSQLQNAVTEFTAGNNMKGRESSERGQMASEIANKIG